MLDHEILKSVAEQMMGSSENPPAKIPTSQKRDPSTPLRAGVGHPGLTIPLEVVVEGQVSPVMRTGARRLRTVRFGMGGKTYQAIEQNAEKPSRWGKLAREGHSVVQFREVGSGKYVAVVVDGKVIEYGR